MPRHCVLLGDSIFDNAAYINGGPDVTRQLRDLLDDGDKASLVAVDGAVTGMVGKQLANLPADASHLVVSAGGNDILQHAAMLNEPADTVLSALTGLAEARDALAANHRKMLAGVVSRGLPVAVCTIYDANYDPPFGRAATTGISIFNDVITRNAHALGCDLIDLRLVCTQREDYANPIEPSERGGAKIARAVKGWLDADARLPGRTRVFF